MEDNKSVASSLIWAVALIVIVGMIVGAVYYSGVLTKSSEKKIDVEIKVPTGN